MIYRETTRERTTRRCISDNISRFRRLVARIFNIEFRAWLSSFPVSLAHAATRRVPWWSIAKSIFPPLHRRRVLVRPSMAGEVETRPGDASAPYRRFEIYDIYVPAFWTTSPSFFHFRSDSSLPFNRVFCSLASRASVARTRANVRNILGKTRWIIPSCFRFVFSFEKSSEIILISDDQFLIIILNEKRKKGKKASVILISENLEKVGREWKSLYLRFDSISPWKSRWRKK